MTPREEEVLRKIREAPYYYVRFIPEQPMNLTLEDTLGLIQGNAVRLRGWDFPYYHPNAAGRSQRYAGVQMDWHRHVELWRMYRSGQFVYFGSPWDLDVDLQSRLRLDFERNVVTAHVSQREDVVGVFSFIGMIYSVTEFFLFIARLAKALETPRFIFQLSMKNINGWALVAGEFGVPWHSFYVSRTSRIDLVEEGYDRLVGDPTNAAAAALKEIFACFGWDDAQQAIASWQQRLLAGRFAF